MKATAKQKIPVKPDNTSVKTTMSKMHPLTDMESMFERMYDRYFGRNRQIFTNWIELPSFRNWRDDMDLRLPSLDLVERDDEILVRAEMPGIEKKDIEITMTGNLLNINGESSSEKKDEKGNYHHHEISSSTFARSVMLPDSLDTSKASARLKDGILEIRFPKTATSKRCSISVS